MRIDSHQHFWDISRRDYNWLTPEMDILYQNYLPVDLWPHIKAGGIGGTILVQAAPTVAETRFLLDLAERTDFIKGVIGWVDFEHVDVVENIRELSSNPYLKGLRPMIQDIEDENWILKPELNKAFDIMVDLGLRFDALIRPIHITPLCAFLKKWADLKVVIDHGAKPEISNGNYDDWACGITALAENKNVYCKLSGLWTEAGGKTDDKTISLYVSRLLEAFGPQRLMWGSDWPVLKLAGEYETWLEQSRNLLVDLTASEKDHVFGKTAGVFYGL